MKRKFYIIGHNPNTVRKAIRCLRDGANAIEPDIRYLPRHDGIFFVYDLLTLSRRKHTLRDYLTGLAAALNKEKLNLALLAFDLKPVSSKNRGQESVVYMEEFFRQLNDFFFKTYVPVPVLLTVGKPELKILLTAARPWLTANQAVGVDHGDEFSNVAYYFTNLRMPFTYANGTSSPFASPLKFKNSIKEALTRRPIIHDLKLVYTWTANSKKTMRYFLDLGVDGMISGRVKKLKKIIDTEYIESVELATVWDNPFA
jgi:hypothetical protein